MKKRLGIDAVEAETVRLIFKLDLEGEGAGGPMGVKTLNPNATRAEIFASYPA